MSKQLGPVQQGFHTELLECARDKRGAEKSEFDSTSNNRIPACDVRTEVDQFIWADEEGREPVDEVAPRAIQLYDPQASPSEAPSHDSATPENIVQLMGKLLENELALPRIVTALAPETTAIDPVHDEEWRRQFLSALRDVDRETPHHLVGKNAGAAAGGVHAAAHSVTPSSAVLPALYIPPTTVDSRIGSRFTRLSRMYATASCVVAPQRHIILAVGTVMAVTGAVSTVIPQITHLSVPLVQSSVGVPVTRQESEAEPPRYPKLNTPVLVREGTIGARATAEAIAVAPSLAAPRRVQLIPVHEPARPMTPPSPTEPTPTIAIQTAPEAKAIAPLPLALGRSSFVPPPNGAGLADLVSRPAVPEAPTTQTTPKHSKGARSSSVARRTKTQAAPRARTRKSAAARSRANSHWESHRNGSRTTPSPEPAASEPSTVTKLLGNLFSNPWASKTPETAQPK